MSKKRFQKQLKDHVLFIQARGDILVSSGWSIRAAESSTISQFRKTNVCYTYLFKLKQFKDIVKLWLYDENCFEII